MKIGFYCDTTGPSLDTKQAKELMRTRFFSSFSLISRRDGYGSRNHGAAAGGYHRERDDRGYRGAGEKRSFGHGPAGSGGGGGGSSSGAYGAGGAHYGSAPASHYADSDLPPAAAAHRSAVPSGGYADWRPKERDYRREFERRPPPPSGS